MASVSASVSTSYSASLSPNVSTPDLAFTSANVRIGVSISIFSLAEVEAKALVHTLADRLTEVEKETLGNTLAELKAKALVIKLTIRLAEV